MLDTASHTSLGDPISQAKMLALVIERHALETESNGTLAAELVTCFRNTGLFQMLVPAELGGLDVDVRTALTIWEEISRADGSTGWSLMANALATGIAASFLSDAAVEHMFGDGRKPVMGGMAGPGGTAVPVDGGYRGSGTYQFGSGCMHADWFCAGMMIAAEGGGVRQLATGGPEIQVCFFPRAQVEILGNWDVFGLSGTGSIDYTVTDRFVESGFCVDRSETRTDRGRGTFKLGIAGMGMAGHTGVALGLAKRALEEVAVIAARRKRPHYTSTLAEHPVFQHDYVLHEASYLAARALSMQVFAEAEQAALSGGGMTPLHFARLRQAVVYIHNVASDVVRFCHVQGGSDALRNPSVLGRCMRDMHTATQHVFVDPTHLMNVAGAIIRARADELKSDNKN